ncbi:MAG TPA: hypothetical protein VG734_18030 [Lacunisphaera sp.]|nr:hypothetical protein [Lacunisphaera sp.]
MIRLTITPRSEENVYSLLTKKEIELRRKNQGTLHPSGPKQKKRAKWAHKSYNGWIRFQQCLGGVVVAEVKSRNPTEEWQLLSSFIGFLDRHFRDELASITLTYDLE